MSINHDNHDNSGNLSANAKVKLN